MNIIQFINNGGIFYSLIFVCVILLGVKYLKRIIIK